MDARKHQGGTMNTPRFRRQRRAREFLPGGSAGAAAERPRHAGRRRRTLIGLAVLSVAAGVAVLPLEGPGTAIAGTKAAKAARDGCTAQISVPNVSITASSPGMFQWVQGTLVQACNAADAKWDAQHGSQAQGSWDFADTATATWPLPYGSGRLGPYQAVPAGAVDAAGNPVPQAAASFGIKFGSRVKIKGYRAGRVAHLRARVTRFDWSLNGGYGGWQPSVNRDVKFYEWHHGHWVFLITVATGADGWTRNINVLAPTRRSFYAHVIQTTTIWGARSYNIRR